MNDDNSIHWKMVSSTENLDYLFSSSFFHWFVLEQPLIYISVHTKLILLKNSCIIYVIYIIFITIHKEGRRKGKENTLSLLKRRYFQISFLFEAYFYFQQKLFAEKLLLFSRLGQGKKALLCFFFFTQKDILLTG